MIVTPIFFHKMVSAKQRSQSLIVLNDDEGNSYHSFEEIADVTVNYFQGLFGQKNSEVMDCSQEFLDELWDQKLDDVAARDLMKKVKDSEIRDALFSIHDDKAPAAPEPDGFSSCFFKKCWPIVREDVKKAVEYFFENSDMFPGFNSTVVALVPKSSNVTTMNRFRPISCCSVVYKIVTKILANRFKKYLPEIIEPNQSAFVGGRSISDNILLAQEIVQGYNRKSISPRCALKVDLQKAFDSLD